MTENIKEAAGIPPQQPDGAAGNPPQPIQPDGPKKRGRPKGSKKIVNRKVYNRPKCETFLQTFPHIIKVIYPSTNSPGKMGICVFKKDERTAGIARFTQNDAGDIYWSCRKIPGPNPFIYDLIEVPAIMLPELSEAVKNIQPFFGGHEQIKETYAKGVEHTDEARKEVTLSDRAKKFTVL